MLGFIQGVDKLSTWVGHAFAWCIMAMALGVGYEVVARKLFNAPTDWAPDLSFAMYGTLFMMGGAYAFAHNAHVRGDVFYRNWAPKTQARVELALCCLFLIPAMLALVVYGWEFAAKSMRYNSGLGEVSSRGSAEFPIWQLKLVIPAAGLLLLIQAIAQVCRCIVCLQTGAWPPRMDDVQETETALAEHAAERQALSQTDTTEVTQGRP